MKSYNVPRDIQSALKEFIEESDENAAAEKHAQEVTAALTREIKKAFPLTKEGERLAEIERREKDKRFKISLMSKDFARRMANYFDKVEEKKFLKSIKDDVELREEIVFDLSLETQRLTNRENDLEKKYDSDQETHFPEEEAHFQVNPNDFSLETCLKKMENIKLQKIEKVREKFLKIYQDTLVGKSVKGNENLEANEFEENHCLTKDELQEIKASGISFLEKIEEMIDKEFEIKKDFLRKNFIGMKIERKLENILYGSGLFDFDSDDGYEEYDSEGEKEKYEDQLSMSDNSESEENFDSDINLKLDQQKKASSYDDPYFPKLILKPKPFNPKKNSEEARAHANLSKCGKFGSWSKQVLRQEKLESLQLERERIRANKQSK